MTVSAGYIAEIRRASEIYLRQGGRHEIRLDRRIARHRPVEDSAVTRIASGILKELRAKFALEAVLMAAVPEDRHEMAPDRVMFRPFLQEGHGS